MRAWTLGSGSRGNGLVLESNGRYLLIDCGFGPRALAQRLAVIGVDPHQIEALVLTHEHIDHASGVERAHHKWRWPVLASEGTLRAIQGVPARWKHVITPQTGATTDAFSLEAVAIPHDAAAPQAYAVTAKASGARVGVAHDLGIVTEGVRALFVQCDALCIEANHNVEMLRRGPYPPALQARIRGGSGHINNAESGELIAQVAHAGLRAVALLHLSETNNTPEQAVTEVDAIVRRAGFRGTLAAAQGRVPGAVFAL